jgi:hypothetical protein
LKDAKNEWVSDLGSGGARFDIIATEIHFSGLTFWLLCLLLFTSFGLMLFLKSFVLILLVLFLGLVYLFHLSVWYCSWIVLFWNFVLFWISFTFLHLSVRCSFFGCIESKTASLLSNKDHVAHILHKINVLFWFVFVFDFVLFLILEK